MCIQILFGCAATVAHTRATKDPEGPHCNSSETTRRLHDCLTSEQLCNTHPLDG